MALQFTIRVGFIALACLFGAGLVRGETTTDALFEAAVEQVGQVSRAESIAAFQAILSRDADYAPAYHALANLYLQANTVNGRQRAAQCAEVVPQRQATPRLAVFPLLSERDPDYGVFMADRLVDELMRHRDIPAWQGHWFELVEADAIPHVQMKGILETKQALKRDDLSVLKTAARADYALIGFVSEAGTRTLHVRIVNLDTGETVWMGQARDDVKWQWIYAQREMGEIALGNLMSQLGFLEAHRHGRMMRADEWPLQVAFAPLYTSQKALVGGYERLIRQEILGSGLFDGLERSQPVGARLRAAERVALTKADAILCGSLMATGKDQAINAVAVALRLIDASSGRVLWTGSAHARRIWRKDRFDDLSQTIATDLVAGLARVKSHAQTDAWAKQPQPRDGPGWVNRGMVALERGLLSDAEEAFLQAESYEGSEVLAYEGLGRVYARRPALRQRAVAYFYQALEADTTRADLYYQMASVYFDIGTGQCVDMAARAIAIDSTYSAPYQLLGDWFARDDFYALPEHNATAAAYYTRYLALEPEDVHAATKLGTVLLRLDDQRAIAQQILPFVERHPEALDLLPIAAQWAYRAAQYDSASMYWNRFLERTDALTLALYVDPSPIFSDAQRAIYRSLPDAKKQHFVDRFWRQKDRDPTTAVNERLQEHYQRVWMARQYFAESAHPWDRRGDVYLRYGEPDYRSRSGRAPGVMSNAVQQVKDRLYAQLYHQPPDGALVGTVFPVRSSRAMAADAVGLMASNSADSHTMGDGYLPVTAGEDHSLVPWESWVYVTIGGGVEITFTDEMGSGHFNFAPVPLRQPPGMRSISRILEHAPETAYTQAIGDVPEQYRPWWKTRDLAFFYDMADARGEGGHTRLDVAFGFPLDAKKIGGGDVTLAVVLYDSVANRAFRKRRTVGWQDSLSGSDALLTDVLTLHAPPGAYQLTVKAENASANRVGLFQQVISVEPYGDSALQISDPVLAAQIDETDRDDAFRRKHLRVLPLPTRAFLVGQEMGLYFEVYNLVADAFGQTRYRVTLQIAAMEQVEGLRKLLTGKEVNPEVSLAFEQVDQQASVQVYQFVDLTKAKQGRNRLTISVEDMNAGQRVAKEIAFRYGK